MKSSREKRETRNKKPSSLLIRDVHAIVTMDDTDTRHSGGYIYIEDGAIRRIGNTVPVGLRAERTIRANTCVAIPGLVNTHHHLFQTLTRACRDTADSELFEWLTRNYPKWAHIDEEAVHIAALVGMAELMLSGCTTTTDHHYLFPKGQTKLIDAQIAAAREIGIRFHPTRGSMDVGKSKGGLPPDSVVQSEDEILADCERVVRKYHDPSPGSMLRVALAPCSPFTTSQSVMRQTVELAEKLDVRMHTHMAETKDEEVYCLQHFKKRPLEFMEDLGWMSDRTWVAHGIHFNGAEVKRLGRAHVGVAHCPTSNMRLSSGICPALALQKAGSPVGLGVDGSASNDSSHLLAEARQALLLNRLAHGAAAMRVDQALHMATLGGAKCLGREDDIGALAAGKRADIAIFDLRDVGYSGAEDPVAALLLCAPQRVQTLVVNGSVVVENGQLATVSLGPIVTRHRKIASNITGQPVLL